MKSSLLFLLIFSFAYSDLKVNFEYIRGGYSSAGLYLQNGGYPSSRAYHSLTEYEDSDEASIDTFVLLGGYYYTTESQSCMFLFFNFYIY